MMNELIPIPKALEAIQSASVKLLSDLPPKQLRLALPCLSRLCFCPPLDVSPQFADVIREIRRLICGVKAGRTLIALMSTDFGVVHDDLIKERNLRRKAAETSSHGKPGKGCSERGLLLEFERSEPAARVRLVLSELLRLFDIVETSSSPFACELSGLFESPVYLDELTDVICVALTELPDLLPVVLLVAALLRVTYGAVILCRVILNFPAFFEEVCSCIISSCRAEMSEMETQIKEGALRMLCQMNPSFCKTMRHDLVTACCLPGLTVLLSTNHYTFGSNCDATDLVPFVSGLLFSENATAREWFAAYLKQSLSHTSGSMVEFRQQLKTELVHVTSQLVSESSAVMFQGNGSLVSDANVDLVHAVALLRLYCGLKAAGYKISSEEADCLLALVTSRPPLSSLGIRFAVVGLCTLLVCTSLIGNQKREEQLTDWLEWLCKNKEAFGKVNTSHSSFGEMLLLIAIHFHSSNLEAIVQLVSSCLEIKVRPGSLTKMKILFTQQLFPEKVVAEHALTVEVTPRLGDHLDGYLPIHCVHQLLKTRSFTKHCVNIQNWIYRQLCSVVAPLHSLLVPLIDAFVHSVVMPLGGAKVAKNATKPVALEGFTEQQIMAVFSRDQSGIALACNVTTQLLVMYYVLLHQDSLLRNMKSFAGSRSMPSCFKPSVYQSIPIKHLLLKASINPKSYGSLHPTLLRLVTTHYPHLCQVEDWMMEEELLKDDIMLCSRMVTSTRHACSPEDLTRVLLADSVNSSLAATHLSHLIHYEPSELVPYLKVVVDFFPILLDNQIPRKIQVLCCTLWSKLNVVTPNRLWLDTVNVLCCCNAAHTGFHPYTEDEIVKDPFIVLRCDQLVFRCPPVFDIVVRLLTSYLAASRAHMQQHLLSNPPPVQNSKSANAVNASQVVEQEREELKNALIAAQESAVAQMLLEICLSNKDTERSGSMIDYTLREIRCRVCSYLHQVFISDPSMAKLVHFQGYPRELLSVTVAGIPSMHICLDFIPELLNMPQLEKQVFAVQLFSHLAVQYPLPKAMPVAQYIVSRFASLVAATASSKLLDFFGPVTPCLVRICRAFPPLKVQCVEALLQLGRVVASSLYVDPRSLDGGSFPRIIFDNSRDQGFEEQSCKASAVTAVKPLSDSVMDLSSQEVANNEELYQTIEKVFLNIASVPPSQ